MKKAFILILLLCSFSISAQRMPADKAEIQRVEPPFWWSGMKNTRLQLMLYGVDIAEYTVTIADKEVILDSITKTENSNYLFLNLDLSKVSGEKKFEIVLNQKRKKKLVLSYELKQREQNSANRNSFNSADVIYLIMPDRFANGDPKNDSHKEVTEKVNRADKGGRHGGDIQGIIDHLGYLDDLGVTALWSTPLLEDNEPVYSYHTYAQSDYYKIDPRYGTNNDYRRLADEMHQRDMKLIMDYVTNHWGSKHWMIKDLPTYDFINQWPEGFKRSNYRMTTQFDQNATLSDVDGCMNGWFDTTMPDMNQRNPLLLNYLIQNAIWWIEFAGLDGLRVDTYSYNNKEGIAKWTKAITDEYPNFNIVGEVWMHDQAQMAYWQKDSKIGAIQNFNSYLPSVMDFTLYDEITGVFNKDKASWDDGIIKIYENFANDFLYPNIDNILVFAGNHDTNRINEIYQSDIDKYRLVMTLILTIRGMPQLYYGDEIGMLGNKNKFGDGDIRRDFPGGWEGDQQNAFTQKGRTESQENYHSFTKRLLTWRKNNEAVHFGKTLQFIPENNVYIYFRHTADQSVMVIINNNIEPQTIDLLRFTEGIKHYSKGIDVLSEKEISLKGELKIEGKKSMVLDLVK